jgi:hypothetical protein
LQGRNASQNYRPGKRLGKSKPLFSEHEFVALREKFPANIKDVEWIAVLDSEGGWAALTAERPP